MIALNEIEVDVVGHDAYLTMAWVREREEREERDMMKKGRREIYRVRMRVGDLVILMIMCKIEEH